jgi:sirohydrochlorin ferrochelatase
VRALLILAHGSRRRASNEEVRELARELRARLGPAYQQVEAAFLELGEPSIDEAIEQAVTAGARRIVLFPYFLAAGRHVAEDIPAIVRACAARHPGVSVELLPYLGASAALLDLLTAELAKAAR